MRKLLLLLALHSVQSLAAVPATVTVASTYYNADASLFNGSIRVTSPPFVCTGSNIAGIDKTYTVTNGVVSISLVPNIGCVGTIGYSIRYIVGTTYTQRFWSIPASPLTTTIDAVQSSLQPSLGLYVSLANIPFGAVAAGQYLGRSADGQSWEGKSASGEPPITAGTIAQYWRGDKTWQPFPTVPSNTSQLPELTNLYFTNARVLSAMSGLYVPPTRTVASKALSADITLVKGDVGLSLVDNTADADKPVSTVQQTALDLKLNSADLTVIKSVNTYPDPAWLTLSIGKITGLQTSLDDKVSLTGSYADPTWITSIPWSKVGGTSAVLLGTTGAGVPSLAPTRMFDVYLDTDVGGLVYIARGTASPSDWFAIGSGAGGTATTTPNYSQAFTSQTVVTLTHNAGTLAVLVECYDSGGEVIFGKPVAATTNTMTMEFAVAETGRCVVNASGGGGTSTGGYTLPTQTGNATKALITDGTQATWQDIGQLQGRAVASTAPASGQAIVWNSTLSRWEPGTVSGGGGSYVSSTTVIVGTGSNNCELNKLCVNGQVVGMQLTATSSLTFNPITSGQCGNATTTIAIPQALNGDSVAAGWPSNIAAGWLGMMYVSAANEVAVRLCNLTGANATPAGGLTYKATVVRLF